MVSRFTPEELAEMAAADAEIESDFRLTTEEWAASRARDRDAKLETYDHARAAHREEINARQKIYYAAHREEINARQKIYYAAHREEYKAYQKAYREAHREEINARQKIYDEAHREELNRKNRERYAAKRAQQVRASA